MIETAFFAAAQFGNENLYVIKAFSVLPAGKFHHCAIRVNCRHSIPKNYLCVFLQLFY